MGARRDALAAAAEVVGVVEEEASATGSTVGTVGQIEARPGGINIIPGRVELSLDLRDIDEAVRDGVEGRIRERAGEACERRGVGLEFEELQRLPPAPCSEEIRAAVAAACEREGIRPLPAAERRRARRDARGGALPDGHDLRPLPRRHQPQPEGVEQPGGLRGRLQRPVFDRARPGEEN